MWKGMPINTAREVAEALCLACVDDTLHGGCLVSNPRSSKPLKPLTFLGRTLYVAKEIVDFELPLHESRNVWMSERQAELFEQGRVRLAVGMGLPAAHQLEPSTVTG